jgi:hypothetical protein
MVEINEMLETIEEKRSTARSTLREMWKYHHPKKSVLLGSFVVSAVGSLLAGEPGLALLILSGAALIGYLMFRSEQRWRAGP